ncbi:MAG: hypothetical protein R2795_24555 [Saprospiraceae bacterium]
MQQKLGKYKNALGAAQKALVLAEKDTPGAVNMLNRLIEELEREL